MVMADCRTDVVCLLVHYAKYS